MRDWSACAAVPASLTTLSGAIVPGYVRQVDTVFEVFGLQVMGATSMRSESDEWLLQSRRAPRPLSNDALPSA